MVNYDPATSAAAQVFPFVDLPSTTTPVTAAWLQHVHSVLTDIAAAAGRIATLEAKGAAYGQTARSGGYIAPLGPTGSGALTGSARAAPIALANSCTADRIGIEITTAQASSTVGLAIYNESATTGFPGSLVLDAGTVDSSSTGFKEITISQALSPGRYWLACRTTAGTNPSARTTTATYVLSQVSLQSDLQSQFTGVQGGASMANPFSTTPALASTAGRVYLRFA